MPANDNDFMTLLTEELNSCEQPKIHDANKASIDEVVRDVHRVLAGNGGPTRGLVVKVAANNVYTKQLRDTVNSMSVKLDNQVTRCDTIQAAAANARAVRDAKKNVLLQIASVLWENKTFIVTAIIAVALYINHVREIAAAPVPAAPVKIDTKLLAQVVSQVVDEKLKELGPVKP